MSLTYRQWIDDTATELGADGCTGVSSLYGFCCREHDVHARLGKRRDGTPISRGENNTQFRSCLQRESKVLGWWNPIAWIRFWGVKFLWREKAQPIATAFSDPIAALAAQDRERIMGEEGLL